MSHEVEYGLEMLVSIVVHVLAEAGEYWKSADATPETASAELEETVTSAPRTHAFAFGAVSEPVGATVSTVNVCVLLVPVFPVESFWVATAVYWPPEVSAGFSATLHAVPEAVVVVVCTGEPVAVAPA